MPSGNNIQMLRTAGAASEDNPDCLSRDHVQLLVARCYQRPVESGSPLVLDAEIRNFSVLEGATDLFAVACVEGIQVGRRFPLGRLAVGDIMINPVISSGESSTLVIIAVAVANTRVAMNLPLQQLSSAHIAVIQQSMTRRLEEFSGYAPVADKPRTMSEFLSQFHHELNVRVAAQDQLEAKRLEATAQENDRLLDSAFNKLASSIHEHKESRLPESSDPLLNALGMVAAPLGIEITAPQECDVTNDMAQRMELIASTSGFRTREVVLSERWWKSDAGPLIGRMKHSGAPVALLPNRGGYCLVDSDSGEERRIDATTALQLSETAVMLYLPLPRGLDSLSSIVRLILGFVHRDIRRYLFIGLLGGALATITPFLTGVLLEHVLPGASKPQLFQVLLGLFVLSLGAMSFSVIQSAILLRMSGKTDLHLQAAVFDRLLRLPVVFFRRFGAGDLAERSMGIHRIRDILTGATISGILGAVFSLSSLGLMFYYHWKLALLGLLLIVISLIVTTALSLWQLRQERSEIEFEGQVASFTTQMLSGISKLRVAAAEERAYARWTTIFAEEKSRFIKSERIGNIQAIFFAFFPTLISIAINIGAVTVMANSSSVNQGLTIGAFIAFSAAFGQLQAAMESMAGTLTSALSIIPVYERIKPIVETQPENTRSETRRLNLKGAIELSHINFRYSNAGRLVLRDLSLQVRPGEFIAIVGPSGCGKSTMLRLLLGFEEAEQGDVLFDGVPSRKLEMGAIRRQTGVVLQNSQLSSGTILSNIVGTSGLNMQDAWDAAGQVGLGEDIENMAMGMHTLIMEGVSTLSGGQKQRLMIARALARDPAILFLDEATSALDNKTQDIVTLTLQDLSCTRIVIAHRLSTIAKADRIFVMEEGEIVQQGNYGDLLNVDGAFRELARRQMM